MASRIMLAAALLALAACSSSSTSSTATGGPGGGPGGGSGASGSSGASTTTTTSGTTAAGSSGSSSSSGTSAGVTRTVDVYTTSTDSVAPTGFAPDTGTCAKRARDTSHCQAARAALGLSGNWLKYSCNVELSLATSSKDATTDIHSASYVKLVSHNLPDFKSNYYATSGTYSFTVNGDTVTGNFADLNETFTTYFPDPSSIFDRTVALYVPLAPAAAASKSQRTMGWIGMALDGTALLDSKAGMTDNIFAESASFDQCGGHPNNDDGYHYHTEPYTISYDDDALIGVMLDGFWLYGRHDADGSTPGDLAGQAAGGNNDQNLIYVYGGHTGSAPSADDTNAFHYHLTEWKGCFDEPMNHGPPSKATDDGVSYDPSGTFNTSASTCSGTWVDGWFVSGHGNGGVFASVPTGIGGQSPAQVLPGIRYFYGTPGAQER